MFLHLEAPIQFGCPHMKIIVFKMNDLSMIYVRRLSSQNTDDTDLIWRMKRGHWHSFTVTSTPKVSFASCTNPASVFVFFSTACLTSFLGAFIASIARS